MTNQWHPVLPRCKFIPLIFEEKIHIHFLQNCIKGFVWCINTDKIATIAAPTMATLLDTSVTFLNPTKDSSDFENDLNHTWVMLQCCLQWCIIFE
jgi:hypothetical protein